MRCRDNKFAHLRLHRDSFGWSMAVTTWRTMTYKVGPFTNLKSLWARVYFLFPRLKP